MSMELIPYKPHLIYLLERALEAEGLSEKDMTFRTDRTCILMDEQTPVGFFSFRMEHGLPYLTHFLVFKVCRADTMLPWLSLFRHFMAMVKALGHTQAIAEVPAGKEFFRSFVRFWNGKDARPYAETGDGSEFYLMPVVRKGGNHENLYLR